MPAPSAGPLREKILVWGGSTAVGHHAVQLAARSGLDVFVTASPAAHAELKALGAAHCFDYKDADVVAKIREAAGEDGIIDGLDTVVEHGSTDAVVVRVRLPPLCCVSDLARRTRCPRSAAAPS
jgi:NADPH:quinone reductase-like Zn-dependent oxidoreductase